MTPVTQPGALAAPLPGIVRNLRRFAQIERIYLFGSRARGDADPRSDIDLAIACPGADARVWADICETLEEADTLLKIDALRLEEAPPGLAERISAEGRLLYERG